MNQVIALKDFEIPRVEVPVGRGKAISVRGLSVDDITFLVGIHQPSIARAILQYQEAKSKIVSGQIDVTTYMMTLARDFPDLVAEVISAAADALDEETRAKARKLPMPVQLSALNEIMGLTLEEVGSLKNLLAEMQGRLQAAAKSAGAK